MQTNDADLDLDSRFRWAVKVLKELTASDPELRTVFDIGSGNESLAASIGEMGLEYQAFDLDPVSPRVRRWNIEEPFPYTGRADVVVLLELVEHLNNPWLGMRNVAAVLKPGGYLILSTPNPSWSGSRLTLLGRGVLTMFTPDDLEKNHHVFTPWRHIVQRLLADNGFVDVRFVSLGKPTSLMAKPFWGVKVLLRAVFRLVKIAIEKRDRTSVGAAFGVIAEKRDA